MLKHCINDRQVLWKSSIEAPVFIDPIHFRQSTRITSLLCCWFSSIHNSNDTQVDVAEGMSSESKDDPFAPKPQLLSPIPVRPTGKTNQPHNFLRRKFMMEENDEEDPPRFSANYFLEKLKFGGFEKERKNQGLYKLLHHYKEKEQIQKLKRNRGSEKAEMPEALRKMNESWCIPEVPDMVAYSVMVEGFCRAHRFDDALKLFRKIQASGRIEPGVFTYTVLIRGLCSEGGDGAGLEMAVALCEELVGLGHPPNFATWAAVVEGYVRDRGGEEARVVVLYLRQRGFFSEEKAVREHLEKKGSFSSAVWEAVFEVPTLF